MKRRFVVAVCFSFMCVRDPFFLAPVQKTAVAVQDGFVLCGIVYHPKRCSALIAYDGKTRVVKEEDVVGDVTIMRIEKNSVLIKKGETESRIFMR